MLQKNNEFIKIPWKISFMARVRLGKQGLAAACLLLVLVTGGTALFQSVHIQALDDQVKTVLARQQLDDPQLLAQAAAEYQARHRTALGLPYAYDLDSYYYLAEAERGSWSTPLIAVYGLAYRAVQALNPNATSSDAVFFLPLVFGLLTLTAFFFLARRMTGSTEAALYAGLVLALHHRFYAGTAAGMADNQSINMLFSVLFFLAFLCALDAWKARRLQRTIAFDALTLLVLALFALTWRGAVYVLAVLVAAGAAHHAILLAKKQAWPRLGMLALALAALAWLFSTTALGKHIIWYLNLVPHGAFASGIAELYGGDFLIFAVALGGWAVLALAAMTWVALAKKNIRAPSFAWLVVLAWFAMLGFATYMTVRFMYFALPPTALLVGVALRHLAVQARARLRSQAARIGVFFAVLVIIGLLMLPLLIKTQHAMQPRMHDGIMGIGTVIEQRTTADTRIISWWEYGHFWNYASKRVPYLDGRAKVSKQEHPVARLWITAHAFLSHDPAEAQALWTALRCRDRAWIHERLGDIPRLSEGICDSPTPAVVVVDERMLDTVPFMQEIVTAQEPAFAAGDTSVTPIEQCGKSGYLLSCGTFTVDLTARTTSDGVPVWLTVNGSRSITNAAERVAVVYESQGAYYAFQTSPWLANTVLVRLLAGESLGIQPLASVDAPERIVAYRTT